MLAESALSAEGTNFFDAGIVSDSLRQHQRQVLETYHDKALTRPAWIWAYLLLAIICLAIIFLLRLNWLGTPVGVQNWALRIGVAAFLAFLVLAICRWLVVRVQQQSRSSASKYNLTQLIRLIGVVVTALIILSALFQNWYTAALSLGLLSLVLGFALQTPIASFVGWLYIIFRQPYSVGDRILIGEFRGEVVGIGYLDTSIREWSGHKFSADLPTGRLVQFPNNLVLSHAIVNYRWNQFPYIWNETVLFLDQDSDLKAAQNMLRAVTVEVLGPEMQEEIEHLKSLPTVRSEEFDEYPFVNFTSEPHNRVRVSILYLVGPRKAASVRNHILLESIRRLNQSGLAGFFQKGMTSEPTETPET